MWFLVLLLAMLFGYTLAKKGKTDLSSWIIAFLAALIIGWIFGLVITAIAPALAGFTLAPDVQMVSYLVLDIAGLVLGLLVAKTEEAIIK